MAWINYRDARDRFSHIDAEFVGASASLTTDGGTAEVVVRFYPWWEHPLYIAARDRGDNWGFQSFEHGIREVKVRAVRPWSVRLSPRQTVDDWAFTESHPLLWDFADTSTVYANTAFEPRDLLDGLLAMRLPYVLKEDLGRYVHLNPQQEVPHGFTIPSQRHEPVMEVLKRLDVSVFSTHTPKAPRAGVVFLLDDDDYIIADDFEVDVPEFTHDPAWFHPFRGDETAI